MDESKHVLSHARVTTKIAPQGRVVIVRAGAEWWWGGDPCGRPGGDISTGPRKVNCWVRSAISLVVALVGTYQLARGDVQAFPPLYLPRGRPCGDISTGHHHKKYHGESRKKGSGMAKWSSSLAFSCAISYFLVARRPSVFPLPST